MSPSPTKILLLSSCIATAMPAQDSLLADIKRIDHSPLHAAANPSQPLDHRAWRSRQHLDAHPNREFQIHAPAWETAELERATNPDELPPDARLCRLYDSPAPQRSEHHEEWRLIANEDAMPHAIASSTELRQDLDYDYIDARIVFGDLTGLSLEGSYQINESWFGTAHLLYGSESITTFTALSAGAGYRLPIEVPSGKLDVVVTGELEYGSLTAEIGPFKFTDNEVGLRLRGGGRYMPNEDWELRAGLGFRTVFSGEFFVDLAGQYNINERWAVVAQLDIGSDFVLFGIGGRLTF